MKNMSDKKDEINKNLRAFSKFCQENKGDMEIEEFSYYILIYLTKLIFEAAPSRGEAWDTIHIGIHAGQEWAQKEERYFIEETEEKSHADK